jgi:hypothetical protein
MGYELVALDLLATRRHHSQLPFTDNWHTQTSVLSLLQSPLTISWQRLRTVEILQLPTRRTACAVLLSADNSTKWVPGWRQLHTNLLVFFPYDDFQLTIEIWTLSLKNQLLHVASLNWTPNSFSSTINSSESELLYNLKFIANQFILATSPLRLMTRIFFLIQRFRWYSLCNILSDERMDLTFTIAAGPRQRSHSQILVLRDPWSYFTVSDSRLPQPGGPGPRIYIIQEQHGPVIHPGKVKVKVTMRLTVSQAVSLGVEPHLELITRYLLLFDSYCLVIVGRPLWREDGSVFCQSHCLQL